MIKTKLDVKRFMDTEKRLYVASTFGGRLKQLLSGDIKLKIYKFLKLLRKEEYYHNKNKLIYKPIYFYWHIRRNKLGIKLGIEMWDGSFDEGVLIAHAGNIVVNGKAKVGKNCILHGSNCIGNNGKTSECPVIGDNVRLGVGASVIGGVVLADNITVAAGAVVVHSFLEPGITIAGVPAKKVK